MKQNKKSKIIKSARKVSIDELFECLSFYAEKENYSYWEGDTGMDISDIEMDFGAKARKLLLKLVKEQCKNAGVDFKCVELK